MISGTSLLGSSGLQDVISAIYEIYRRAIDGTTLPLFVDSNNGRVLIGSTSASASPAKVEITGGDLKVVTAGKGVILSDRAGTKFYRLIIDNDGVLAVDPL